jgi:hypothetical protein
VFLEDRKVFRTNQTTTVHTAAEVKRPLSLHHKSRSPYLQLRYTAAAFLICEERLQRSNVSSASIEVGCVVTRSRRLIWVFARDTDDRPAL